MYKFAVVIVSIACFYRGSCRRLSFNEGNFNVSWSYNRVVDQLNFEVDAKARGWIGFGFTFTPDEMQNYDVVIGGQTEEGESYFNDFTTLGFGIPQLDMKQSYKLDNLIERNGITSLRYHRPRNTSDTQDIQFNHTTRVWLVWGYNDVDDASNPSMFSMHTQRGHSTGSFHVLSSDYEQPTIQTTTPKGPELETGFTVEYTTDSSQPTSVGRVNITANAKSSGCKWIPCFVITFAVTILCILGEWCI